MIHAVVGELVSVGAQRVVLRTAVGMEFELLVSSQTVSKLSQLQGDARRQVRLLSWLQHREDSMTLYGFVDEEERMLFLELVKINGIGPRQALKIISGVQVRAFIQALDENNIAYLASIPGVGPKTSQKIMLALRDTIGTAGQPKEETGQALPFDRRYSDLVAALTDMGYDRRRVVSTITGLLEEHRDVLTGKSPQESEEFLFKNSIRKLG